MHIYREGWSSICLWGVYNVLNPFRRLLYCRWKKINVCCWPLYNFKWIIISLFHSHLFEMIYFRFSPHTRIKITNTNSFTHQKSISFWMGETSFPLMMMMILENIIIIIIISLSLTSCYWKIPRMAQECWSIYH